MIRRWRQYLFGRSSIVSPTPEVRTHAGAQSNEAPQFEFARVLIASATLAISADGQDGLAHRLRTGFIARAIMAGLAVY